MPRSKLNAAWVVGCATMLVVSNGVAHGNGIFTPAYAGQPAPGSLYWGAAVGGNSDPLERHEVPTGASLPIRRTYFRWDQRTSSMLGLVNDDHASDRLPWISLKTPAWSGVAAGQYDAEIDQLLTKLKNSSKPVWLTFWHEPENDLSIGSAVDHVAMNRRVRQRIDALGADNIALAANFMAWTWDSRSGRNPESWWSPGIYDVLGIDIYQETEASMLTTNWYDVRRWAGQKGVDVAVGEWGMRGTNAAAGDRVRAWYEGAIGSASDGRGARVVALSAFDSSLNSPTGSWELQGQQLNAFHQLMVNPRTARLSGAGVPSSSKIISVDIGDADKSDDGTFIGPAVAPGDVASPVWNDITYGQPMFMSSDLLFTDGTVSGIDMKVLGTSAAFGGGIDWQNIQPTHQENRLTRDRAFNNTVGVKTFTLTLSQLNAGDTYDFYLYTGSGYSQEITVNNVTKIATAASEFDDGSLGPMHTFPTSTTWIEGEHYVVFSDITGITELDITYTAGAATGWQPGTAAVLPGFQIVVDSTVTPLAGDYNGNGKVDAADYVLWRKGGPLQNEVADVGTVSPADYTEWRSRFGNPAGSGLGNSFSAVPEPGCGLMLVFGSLFGCARSRLRRTA